MHPFEGSQGGCATVSLENSGAEAKFNSLVILARDRRENVRRRVKPSVILLCNEELSEIGAWVFCKMQDVSRTGACFLHKEPLAPGQEIRLHMWGENYSMRVRVEAKVVWSMPHKEGFQIGVWFHLPLSHADLTALAS